MTQLITANMDMIVGAIVHIAGLVVYRDWVVCMLKHHSFASPLICGPCMLQHT
jgi:hypothetical protein